VALRGALTQLLREMIDFCRIHQWNLWVRIIVNDRFVSELSAEAATWLIRYEIVVKDYDAQRSGARSIENHDTDIAWIL
jgi:hypothetical protein